MPLSDKDLERALTAARVSEDTLGARVRILLEDARKDIVAEIGANPAVWRIQFLNELLDRIDERIIRLTADFGRLSSEMSTDAIARGLNIGQLAKPITAPTSMVTVSPQLLKSLADYRSDLLTGVTDNIRNTVTEIVRRGVLTGKTQLQVMKEIGDAVGKGRFKNLSYRAEMIFRTEFVRIGNIAGQEGMLDSAKYIPGLRKKWITSLHNSRPAHIAANGQVVLVEKPYRVDGEDLMYPLDPHGSPQNVINCRCLSVPVIV